jgi:hypothetical protein
MAFSFFNSKKAQGMSLNVIIIAVIAIIILVVLIFIFTGKTRLFSKTTTSCTGRGGQCVQGTACQPGYIAHAGTDCDEKEKCCVPFDVQEKTKSS